MSNTWDSTRNEANKDKAEFVRQDDGEMLKVYLGTRPTCCADSMNYHGR
jgi:hypothetical protein